MKKLLIVFLIIGIYLNRSYAHFYNFLDQQHLVPPAHETKTIIGHNMNSKTIKYAALGDSLTAGVGVSDIKSSYPYLIAQKLSLKNNVELINLSQSGATSKDVLADQLPKALSEKPDLVTVLVGANDIHNLKSLEEFKDNYTQIVGNLKKSGAKIYLLSIPYLGSDKIVYFPYNLMLNLRTGQFNNVIKKVAADIGTEYVDLYSLNKSASFYSSDQFHPSEEGYKEWSRAANVN